MEMAIVYQEELKEGVNKDKEHNIKARMHLATQGSCFSFMISRDFKSAENNLQQLKKNKLYPYPIIWRHILPTTSLKHSLINWVTLFYPLEGYYLFFCKLVAKKILFKL